MGRARRREANKDSRGLRSSHLCILVSLVLPQRQSLVPGEDLEAALEPSEKSWFRDGDVDGVAEICTYRRPSALMVPMNEDCEVGWEL